MLRTFLTFLGTFRWKI